MTKKNWISKLITTSRRSHVIAIFAVFKKLSQKRSYKLKHFVFKTLKLLILEFQFWIILGVGHVST